MGKEDEKFSFYSERKHDFHATNFEIRQSQTLSWQSDTKCDNFMFKVSFVFLDCTHFCRSKAVSCLFAVLIHETLKPHTAVSTASFQFVMCQFIIHETRTLVLIKQLTNGSVVLYITQTAGLSWSSNNPTA